MFILHFLKEVLINCIFRFLFTFKAALTHTHTLASEILQHFCLKQACTLFPVNDFSFVKLSVKMLSVKKKKLISCLASVNHERAPGLELTVFRGGDLQSKGNVP